MIHHLVLIRLKEGVSREDPRLQEALGDLIALREKIDGIVRWEHGWDFVRRPISYDGSRAATGPEASPIGARRRRAAMAL